MRTSTNDQKLRIAGSYSLVWAATAAAGLFAAMLHFPIDDTVVHAPALSDLARA